MRSLFRLQGVQVSHEKYVRVSMYEDEIVVPGNGVQSIWVIVLSE
jgi:hypothetical protein